MNKPQPKVVPPEAKSEKTSPEVERLQKELWEMTDLAKRTQANLENYRKQVEKRMEELEQQASRQVLLDLLPIIDNFELALKNKGCAANSSTASPEFVQGMELIYAQFISLLEKKEVKIMETTGKKFDPYYHEALLRVESEQPENIILEEFQKGYTLHGKVLRHAKVKISAGKKQEEKNKENDQKSNQENKNPN